MKRVLTLVVALLLVLFCGCTEKSSFPTATEEFYVNDFADVISETDEQKILSNAVALAQKTTAQVVVVTVEDLDGETPADYALEIGRKWGVGDKEKDNGVVILLSEGDREIYISVGYGLEGALPDSKTGRIIDSYGMEYLRADDFSKGLFEISKQIVGEVYIEYGLEPQSDYVSFENVTDYYAEQEVGDVISSWVIMLIIIVILSFLFRGRGGMLFLLGPSFRSGRGGFGSFGGGSSFGGFRGGGGGFGGGGAGRGF